jgi:hypothetical protein
MTAKTPAQRQAEFRAKHKLNYADGSTDSMTYTERMAVKVRLDTIITHEAKKALDRLACANGLPINNMLIELILNADKKHVKSLGNDSEAKIAYELNPL